MRLHDPLTSKHPSIEVQGTQNLQIIVLRWILEILHDPGYLESWYYSILRSCRIVSINSRKRNRRLWAGHLDL